MPTGQVSGVGTSPVRSNVRVDNTPPTGSLIAPLSGATVGGNAVHLATSASDAGSGVASVRYELRPTGGGSFSTITTSTSSPFDGTWNTTGLASGSYDLRPVITDKVGNSYTGAVVTVTGRLNSDGSMTMSTTWPSMRTGRVGATCQPQVM